MRTNNHLLQIQLVMGWAAMAQPALGSVLSIAFKLILGQFASIEKSKMGLTKSGLGPCETHPSYFDEFQVESTPWVLLTLARTPGLGLVWSFNPISERAVTGLCILQGLIN